jgi:hypothetical protein
MGRSYSASFWPMYKDGLGRVFGHYAVVTAAVEVRDLADGQPAHEWR